MMKWLLVALMPIAMAFIGLARAEQFDAARQPTGELTKDQTVVGPSPNTLKFPVNSGYVGVIFTGRNTAGNVTVALEMNCTGDPRDWAVMQESDKVTTTGAGIVRIMYPFCEYRSNVTACQTCNVSVFYNLQSAGS